MLLVQACSIQAWVGHLLHIVLCKASQSKANRKFWGSNCRRKDEETPSAAVALKCIDDTFLKPCTAENINRSFTSQQKSRNKTHLKFESIGLGVIVLLGNILLKKCAFCSLEWFSAVQVLLPHFRRTFWFTFLGVSAFKSPVHFVELTFLKLQLFHLLYSGSFPESSFH